MPRGIRFDRNEWAGSFGDIGTDLPLVFGMVLAAGLDAASVFTVFGLLQIATGLVYRLPMPMQPLKAMAVLVISGGVAAETLYGAGVAIGAVMLLLASTGALGWVASRIPLCVVRGIQLGLGLALASLALRNYVPAQGTQGYLLAAVAFAALVVLWGNRRIPAGLVVVGLGLVYALAFRVDLGALAAGAGLALPRLRLPELSDVASGFVVLALPQLPLSLSNSVIATERTLADLFPARRVSVRKIGLTYSAVNLLAPLAGGVPACHGAGGLAGHYALGARSGGSVVLYGGFFVLAGLFLSGALEQVVEVFPLPILGVVLLAEALTLMRFVGDQAGRRRDLAIALLVGVLALSLPQGYLVGLVVGILLYHLPLPFGGPDPADADR
jgi:hypothetical protein